MINVTFGGDKLHEFANKTHCSRIVSPKGDYGIIGECCVWGTTNANVLTDVTIFLKGWLYEQQLLYFSINEFALFVFVLRAGLPKNPGETDIIYYNVLMFINFFGGQR